MRIIAALCGRNLKNFVRNRTGLALSIIIPFFFIWIFSEVFSFMAVGSPVGFVLAGITIVTVFDTSLRISSSTIDDMAGGFMKEVLVSPVSRLSVAVGQFLSSAIIASVQGMILLAGGLFLGFRITEAITVVYIILALVTIALVFAGFGLFIASNAKNAQTKQAK